MIDLGISIKNIVHITVLALVVFLGACSVFHGPPFPLEDETIHVVWPQSPETAKIKLLRVISGPETILPERSKFQKLVESITGEYDVSQGFSTPAGIAADGERFIYIADTAARMVHRYDLQTREVSYITSAAGDPFASPIGVAVDREGSVYVTDSVLCKVFKFNQHAEFVGLLGKGVVEYKRPAGIAVSDSGEKYVVDVLARKLIVFDKNDNLIGDFPSLAERNDLVRPINVAVDKHGRVYVTDSLSFEVKVYSKEGKLQRKIGQIGDAPGSFARPKGVALDSDGHIYSVDANFDNFQIFDSEGRFLMYVGKTGIKFGEFYLPNGIFIDQKDRIYVSDSYNRRIQVFQYLKNNAQTK